MALRAIAVTALALALSAPAAHAKVAHTVAPGETLWSIAAASNLTTRTLAAANGLPENGTAVVGSTIWIPSEAEGAAALAGAGVGPSTGGSAAAGSTSDGAPPPLGAYVVQPGDTLSGLAALSGVPVAAVASMNGLDPSGTLVAGTPLKLPTGAPGSAGGPGGPAAAPSTPAPSAAPDAAPSPTPGRATSSQIGQVASEHGVPPSLAAAVAWQESGFNNSAVSSANARGVMQVMPGTWSWVEDNLAGRALDPSSTEDNVRAGVMYLGQLLRDTGGDEAAATAAYYQGLESVRTQGMLPETQRYVDNVMALRPRFGGP